MLFAIVLLLAQMTLAIQANVVPSDIERLCAGKPIELTKISELQELGKAARQSSCPPYLKEAIVELSAIVSIDRKDLCAPDAIDTLRAFYTQYMDNASVKEDHKKQLPDSLLKFVVAYGMQMSNLCKKNMVKVLSEEARDMLTPEDFKQVDKLTDGNGPLAGLLQTMGGVDEIFLPGDLAPLMKDHGAGQATSEKVFMQTATAPWVKRLQSVCQHRFKPIYQPLMIPITRLSYMGFNYKDDSLKCSLACPKSIIEVGQWARIVLLCESLASVYLVEDPASKELTEGTDETQVKIISRDEAAAIVGAGAIEAAEQSDATDAVYTPKAKVELGDLVLEKANVEFGNALKSFKVGQSEAELTKRTMVTKGMAFVKGQLRKGKVGFLVSAAYKSLTNKETKSSGSFMVRTMNEIVAKQQDGAGEHAVSFASGMSVAGLAGGATNSDTGATYGDGGLSDVMVSVLINTVLLIMGIGMCLITALLLG